MRRAAPPKITKSSDLVSLVSSFLVAFFFFVLLVKVEASRRVCWCGAAYAAFVIVKGDLSRK